MRPFILLLLLATIDCAIFVTTVKHAPQISNQRPACVTFPDPMCPPGSTMTHSWTYTENAGDYTRNCVTHASCSET